MSVHLRRPKMATTLATALAAVTLLACGSLRALEVTPQQQQAGGAVVAGGPANNEVIQLPNHDNALKFLAFGDFGTGDKVQYDLAQQMAKLHDKFKFEMAILLGDNLYGPERPQDFVQKFEAPYKPLLDAGVKFYAALGNHDAREMIKYPLFDMGDKLFYSFKAPKQSVRFYALESTYMTPEQVTWIGDELKNTNDDWKIPFFHHPLYSSARAHGSTDALRESLEPLFIRYNVSVVFNGHDHVYERTKPQNGIVYFVAGSGGKLRAGDLDPKSPLTARGFDTDLAFVAAEIEGDNMIFQVISRAGKVVDSGVVIRRKPARPLPLLLPRPAPPWASPSPSPLQTGVESGPRFSSR